MAKNDALLARAELRRNHRYRDFGKFIGYGSDDDDEDSVAEEDPHIPKIVSVPFALSIPLLAESDTAAPLSQKKSPVSRFFSNTTGKKYKQAELDLVHHTPVVTTTTTM